MYMKKILVISFIIISTLVNQATAANIARPILENVAAGKTIAGVLFEDNIIARAEATYYGGSRDFDVEVEYFRLPALPEWYLYEGWLVNRETNHYISTGDNRDYPVLNRRDAKNLVSVKKDLRSYDYHVLTIELDDGNTDPGEHILEWEVNIKVLEDTIKKGSTRYEEAPKREVIAVFADEIKTPQQKIIADKISNFSDLQLEQIVSKLPNLEEKYKNNTAISQWKKEDILQILTDIKDAIEEKLN